MPLYQITRDFAGVTNADLTAAGIRAKMCISWLSGLRWIESFHDTDREITTCIYEAASVEDLRTHSKIAAIPCGEIREVDLIRPEDIEEPPPTALASGDSTDATA